MASTTELGPVTAPQAKTIEILHAATAEASYIIEELEWNNKLEIYCEIRAGRFSISIAKGWADPGLRVFAWIEIPPDLTHSLTLGALATRCAVSGLALTHLSDQDPTLWQVETVIYMSGLNRRSFRELLVTFAQCLDEVHDLTRALLLTRKLEFINT